jgi:hypothetical protein
VGPLGPESGPCMLKAWTKSLGRMDRTFDRASIADDKLQMSWGLPDLEGYARANNLPGTTPLTSQLALLI